MNRIQIIEKAISEVGRPVELAKRLGVTQTTVHKWRRGKGWMSPITAIRFEKHFGIDRKVLLPEVFDE